MCYVSPVWSMSRFTYGRFIGCAVNGFLSGLTFYSTTHKTAINRPMDHTSYISSFGYMWSFFVSREISLFHVRPPYSLFFFSRKREKNALLPARDTDRDKYRGHDPEARYRKVSNIVCDKDNSIDLIQTKEQYQCLKYCSYLI